METPVNPEVIDQAAVLATLKRISETLGSRLAPDLDLAASNIVAPVIPETTLAPITNINTARPRHETKRGGAKQRLTKVAAGVMLVLGLASVGDGLDKNPGRVAAEAQASLPNNYEQLPGINLISSDASVEGTGSALSDVETAKNCDPRDTEVVFHRTAGNEFGEAVTGETVDEIKTEFYTRLCEDPALMTDISEKAELYKLDVASRQAKIQEYIQNEDIWAADFDTLVEKIEAADVTIDSVEGRYITDYMTDNNQDGVPEIVVGLEKSTVKQRTLLIKFKDGKDLEVKLGCGIQPVEEKTPPKATPPKVVPPPVTPPSTAPDKPTTTTTKPEVTTTTKPEVTTTTKPEVTTTTKPEVTTTTKPEVTTTTKPEVTTTTKPEVTTTTKPEVTTTTKPEVTTTTKPPVTTTTTIPIPDKRPAPPVVGGPPTTVEAPVPGPSVPTTRPPIFFPPPTSAPNNPNITTPTTGVRPPTTLPPTPAPSAPTPSNPGGITAPPQAGMIPPLSNFEFKSGADVLKVVVPAGLGLLASAAFENDRRRKNLARKVIN